MHAHSTALQDRGSHVIQNSALRIALGALKSPVCGSVPFWERLLSSPCHTEPSLFRTTPNLPLPLGVMPSTPSLNAAGSHFMAPCHINRILHHWGTKGSHTRFIHTGILHYLKTIVLCQGIEEGGITHKHSRWLRSITTYT
ncbi:hypothetical protein E2C01_010311 [Portunus trituberculatus]|uniref:Uncharacterized protein n=1 Tax=Portunus trituberculatus TaxID=210409 RepID=A0A5B7D8C5_PORTR|nr:hypothetical protein [Portunus trituberculatus]